jgi:hypothetical protein
MGSVDFEASKPNVDNALHWNRYRQAMSRLKLFSDSQLIHQLLKSIPVSRRHDDEWSFLWVELAWLADMNAAWNIQLVVLGNFVLTPKSENESQTKGFLAHDILNDSNRQAQLKQQWQGHEASNDWRCSFFHHCAVSTHPQKEMV